MNFWRILALSIMITGLAACGWHLRGLEAINLPFEALYLNSDIRDSALVTAVEKSLENQNIQLSDTAEGIYRLNLENYREERRVLTTDNRGRASDYELTSRVDMSLDKGEEQLLIPMETLTLTRSYNFDPDNVASANQEESLIRQEMKEELARRILLRLQALSQTP